MTRRATLLAVLLTAAALSDPATCADSSTWEVWYSVSARERGPRADADLEAGGRLLMTGLAGPSGKLSLRLGEVLEHPWKLYWVDPLGPFGEEVKMASVMTLPEATWAALEAARATNAARAKLRHESWLEGAERSRALDGSFAFIVIGSTQGRFRLDIDVDGSVSSVTNRMTHRWLPGPFDPFVGTWTGSTRDDPPPAAADVDGYWFWNNGESEPFDYEPHTYHAFSTALKLLAVPVPRTPGSVVSWPDAVEMASEVIGTLAPKARTRLFATGRRTPFEAPVRAETLPNGDLRLSIEFSKAAPTLHVERETVFSSAGRPVSSRARVRLESRGGGFLEVETGYRSRDQVEDSE